MTAQTNTPYLMCYLLCLQQPRLRDGFLAPQEEDFFYSTLWHLGTPETCPFKRTSKLTSIPRKGDIIVDKGKKIFFKKETNTRKGDGHNKQYLWSKNKYTVKYLMQASKENLLSFMYHKEMLLTVRKIKQDTQFYLLTSYSTT